MDIRTERLNKAFEASGLSQAELCEKAGINKGALSSYLSGRYFPKQVAVEKLSSALGVSVQYLMGYDASTHSHAMSSFDFSDRPNLHRLMDYFATMSESQLQSVITLLRIGEDDN